MKKIHTLFVCLSAFSICQAQILITEFHYDNMGSDLNERIEVFGPAGTDISNWKIILYNGSNGQSYGSIILSGSIPDQTTIGGNHYGASIANASGIQNGAPDGFALINASGQVVEFISYEGSFAATNGAASGLTSVDCGVSEDGVTGSSDGSISRGSLGNAWTVNTNTNTFGLPNTNFILPLTCHSFSAYLKNEVVSISWKATCTNQSSWFDLERSADGKNYNKITRVTPKGIGEFEYSFMDKMPVRGIAFYRLKLVDQDSFFSYTPISRIKWSKGSVYISNLYPSKAGSQFNVQIHSNKQYKACLEIMEVSGRLMKKQSFSIQEGNLSYPIDISSLPIGVYILLIHLNDEVLTAKFVNQ